MHLTVVTRTTAIGVALGLFATSVITRATSELAAAPAKIALLAGPVVLFYGVCGALLGILVLGIEVLLRRSPLDLRGLFSARSLWSLLLLGIAFGAFNQAVRSHVVADVWKVPGRSLLGVLAALVIGAALVRGSSTRLRVHLFERVLALGLIPAMLGAGIYFTRGASAAPQAPAAGNVIALAPRFTPEPETVFQPLGAGERPRIILLGLDGAAWDRIDRGIRAGRLPTFKRLREGGVHAPLATLSPTHSPMIWTSIVTGVPPSVHGITDFYLIQLQRLDIQNFHVPRGLSPLRVSLEALGEIGHLPVTSSLRRCKAIWNIADEAGMRTAVLGLWATWPPEPLQHGLMVSDHASLARRYEWLDRRKTDQLSVGTTTYPEGLAEGLARFQRAPDSVTREELAEFLPVDDALWEEFRRTQTFSKDVALSAFRSTHLNDAFFLESARHLWEDTRPDLMVVYAKAIDELSHFFYEAGVPEAEELGHSFREIERYRDVMDRTYEWTDRQIAPLVDAVDRDGNTLLVLVSDHGWEKEADGNYNHSYAPSGILVLYGAGVCSRDCPTLADAHVYDIAPTILVRLGLPISDEMVGRPLSEAFREEREVLRVARYGDPLTAARAIPSEIDAALTEKLEALGYMD